MKLVAINKAKHEQVKFLYDLLAEREPEESISHKTMPTFPEHQQFVKSNPYFAWYLIEVGKEHVGTIYLTRGREIGISILKSHRRKGYAEEAIRQLMERWPGKFYANINPANIKSIMMFGKFGFGLVQHTYAK